MLINLPVMENVLLESVVRVAVIILGALIAKVVLQRVIVKSIDKHLKFKSNHKNRVKTLITVFSGTSSFIISVTAILLILPEFGVNIAALLTGLGVMGLAVSLASQSIVTDFISGIFIIIEDQYMIGDKVKIAGIEGVVKEMSLRRTVVEDSEGTTHSIPNGQIKGVAKIRS
ncbi:MAG: mechanosensitive ion channel domain-containing protein [Minisyncoccales bacterium]|jgi:small-conductance mechanosensitive channel